MREGLHVGTGERAREGGRERGREGRERGREGREVGGGIEGGKVAIRKEGGHGNEVKPTNGIFHSLVLSAYVY